MFSVQRKLAGIRKLPGVTAEQDPLDQECAWALTVNVQSPLQFSYWPWLLTGMLQSAATDMFDAV